MFLHLAKLSVAKISMIKTKYCEWYELHLNIVGAKLHRKSFLLCAIHISRAFMKNKHFNAFGVQLY